MTTAQLNRQFNNILGSQNTDNEKVRLLIQLGLTENVAADIVENGLKPRRRRAVTEIVSNEIPAATAAAVLYNYAGYTFGVEIECFSPRQTIIDSCRAENVRVVSDCYGHNDRYDNVVKLVSDGSLSGHVDPVECVTSVLRADTNGRDLLHGLCNGLAAAGAVVNRTCGLHIHIGAEQLTDNEYCNVFVNYMYLQPRIDSFMPNSRRGCEWSKRLILNENAVLSARTKLAMFAALNNSRYWAVNPHAYIRHKTIEFRQHSATIEYQKIDCWLQFCIRLIEWSKINRLTAETAPRSIDELPFLDTELKTYFNSRAAKFATAANVAAA